jgi:hypothetical protein
MELVRTGALSWVQDLGAAVLDAVDRPDLPALEDQARREGGEEEVKGFIKFVRRLDWFEWFWLLYVVFVSTLFWTVVDEIDKAIHG